MSELILVNPRKRRRRASAKRRRVRRMTAKQMKYFAPRSNPRRRRRHVARKRNPSRRRHYAVHRHTVRRRRRNPSFRSLTGSIVPTLEAGAYGAAGGLAADLAYGFTSTQSWFPSALAAAPGTPMYLLAKLALAFGVGALGNLAFKGKGQAFAVGATTVALHDFVKAQLANSPSFPLGAYLTMAPTVSDSSPGNYATNRGGFYNPSVQAQRAIRMDTYKPVGRLGRVGGMGLYLNGMRGVRGIGDATYGNGIPTGSQ
jgi:hypothetical protein